MKNEVIQSPSLKVQMTRNFLYCLLLAQYVQQPVDGDLVIFQKNLRVFSPQTYHFSLKWATVDKNTRILNKKKTVKDCQRFLILILFITRM